MPTCRLCDDDGQRLMVKYSTRHYAHAECALNRWGASFFDRLTRHQLECFPYLLAVRLGLGPTLVREIENRNR
jgi:hypothetical protein